MAVIVVTGWAPISWVVTKADATYFDLPLLPGWSIVNPAYHKVVPGIGGIYEQRLETRLPLMDGRYLIGSPYMVFRVPSVDGSLEMMEIFAGESVPLLLRRLRLLSCQALMPENFSTGSTIAEGKVDVLRMFDNRTALNFHGSSNYSRIGTPITPSMFLDASNSSNWDLTVWDTTFLDAIAAYGHGNMRSALLSAAATMEIAGAAALDERMSVVKANPIEHPNLRIRTTAVGAGKTVVTDPIDDILRQRENFSTLLYERSLYVLGRSIKYDDEPLYHAAMKLYKTRNKIVHRGVIPDSVGGDYYAPETVQVIAAIRVAIGVTRWFGSGQHYLYPGEGLT